MQIVVKYIEPKLLASFLFSHNIGFNVKFKYDQSYWKLSSNEFNDIFGYFPNIVIYGIWSTDCSMFYNVKIPVIHSNIKRMKITHDIYTHMSLYSLRECVNLRYLWGSSKVLTDGDIEILRGFRKLRHFMVSIYNNYMIDVLVNVMPKLRSIYLPLHRVLDFGNLVKFQMLRNVNVFGNIDDIKIIVLGGLKRMRRITFLGTLQRKVPDLSGCCELRCVNFVNCDYFNGFDGLCRIRELRSVRINFNNVSVKSDFDQVFDKCVNLRVVEINGNVRLYK